MKKEEELLRNLNSLIKETQAGALVWDVLCQTTEYDDSETKPTEESEEGLWIIDECFVCYHCVHGGQEFLMITYEKISTCGEKQKSHNMIFLPPLGNRYFSLELLAPYAVQAEQMLVYDVHLLWMSILEQYRSNPERITLEVTRRPQ